MAAFIPSRRDEEVNRTALARVRDDKNREAGQGFDGTWVAHPDLVPVAKEIFDQRLGDRPNQKDFLREDVAVTDDQLLDFRVEGGRITEAGVRTNVGIALQYLDSWLQGQGAAGIHNLMEDAATAEISRTQLWQWIWNGAHLDDGRQVTADLYRQIRDQEVAALGDSGHGRLADRREAPGRARSRRDAGAVPHHPGLSVAGLNRGDRGPRRHRSGGP